MKEINKPTARPDSVVSFEDVTFEYGVTKPILEEANFNIRRGSKITDRKSVV